MVWVGTCVSVGRRRCLWVGGDGIMNDGGEGRVVDVTLLLASFVIWDEGEKR